MSHLNERSEKNCLNCNAQVHGKYCHNCGQENVETFETAWHLVTHFFNDITHFDGKFFSTLKYLVFKPGFLSSEYMIGRRASYLNPVRMYVFTSAIFFLIFFSINKIEENILDMSVSGKTTKQIDAMDPATFNEFTKTINNGRVMTRESFKQYVDSLEKVSGIHFSNARYTSRASYDSLLKSGKKDDNWLKRQLVYKEIEANEKYRNNQRMLLKAFTHNLFHSFPQMLFISLPLFALLLKLLYLRHKKYFYASHAIFSIHFYVFVFILLLVEIGLQQAGNFLNWNAINYLMGLIFAFIFYYEYKAMRNFYQQGRGKTIFKFIILNTAMIFVIILLFTVFTFLSLFKV